MPPKSKQPDSKTEPLPAGATRVRDLPGIAAAWGVALYEQRPRKLKQLDAIRACTAREDFPAKIKGWWPREQVVAWGKANLELHVSGRKFQINHQVTKATKAETPEKNASGGTPPEQDELFGRLAGFTPDKQRRLMGLYAKWQDPQTFSLTQAEHRELISAGLVDDAPKNANGLPIAGGSRVTSQAHMAEIITKKFGVACAQKDISDWIHARRLPPNAPAFPPPDKAEGDWTSDAPGIAWYEQWIHKPLTATGAQGELNLSTLALQAKYQREIDEANIKAHELASLKAADDKNYITRAEHRSILTGTHKLASGLVTDAIEKKMVARCAAVLAQLLPDETARQNVVNTIRDTAITINQELHREIPARMKDLAA